MAGRPTSYSEELANQICELIAEGKTLLEIGRRPEFPDRSTVQRWAISNQEFAAKLATARDLQGDHVFDELSDLEEQVISGDLDPSQAAVAIKSKQWRAARLAQKRYGDRQTVDTTTTIDVADRIVARWRQSLARLDPSLSPPVLSAPTIEHDESPPPDGD